MIYSSPCNNVHTGFIVDYHRTRTGPNYFMVFYKNCSRIVTEPIEVSRILGTARYLDSSKTLRAWCEEMVEQYGEKKEEKKDEAVMEYAKTQGFGPEAHAEASAEAHDEDPTANTKMVI